MDKKQKKSAENLGVIRTNNGQSAADLVRERDPSGATVVHAVSQACVSHTSESTRQRPNSH